MSDQDQDQGLEDFRPYLTLLARLRLPPQIQSKLDANDIVQQTLLEAYQARDRCQGWNRAQQAAWLRQILVRNLANAVRDLSRARRDVAREQSLDAALEESSSRLEAWLAAEQSSPSQQAEHNEQAVRLARALASLPDAQREVVMLRHLEGRPLADISRQIGRSPAAVAGLLHRGLEQLRALLQEPE
jgi:RNA polymerase sigma-70 factor (ECF subfamily)